MKKTLIACLCAATFTSPAWAQNSTLQEQLSACSAITADAERLQCFDTLSASQAATTAPSSEATAKAEETQKRRLFGLRGPKPVKTEEEFGLKTAPEKEITQINAQIVDAKFRLDTAYRIELDNGQVWAQLDSDSKRLRLRKNQTHTAVITKGAFGGFWMKVEPGNTKIRVRRVK